VSLITGYRVFNDRWGCLLRSNGSRGATLRFNSEVIVDAPQRFAAEIKAFGCMSSNKLTPMQIGQLQALAAARGDEAFARYVAEVAPSTAAG
jgi:hypothetical protein